jgi:UDP-N-acetylmuramoylalanine--D-glutamate ligase
VGRLREPLLGAAQVTVWGLGWTGVAAANLGVHLGKRVIATDTRAGEALERALAELKAQEGVELDPRVEVRSGAHEAHGSSSVILTQSLKHSDPAVLAARAAGVSVVPEVEWAAEALRGLGVSLVAIGGTDGKTTTTKLAGHLAGLGGRRAWVGGNSWEPLSALALRIERELEAAPLGEGERATVVAEVSAFQLPPWHRFRPKVAAVTNVAEDHVDEFFGGSWEAYVAAKRALTDALEAGDVAVLNVDDARVRSWEPALRARGVRVVRVSLSARAVMESEDAAYRQNGEFRVRWDRRDIPILRQEAWPLIGDHNAENALMAVGAIAGLGLGLSAGEVGEGLRSFRAPHHRLERVARVGGVEVYDDSKATNVHAALAGLAAFGGRPLVVIAGGVDKGLDLEVWVEALRTRARAVIVLGQLRARVRRDYAEKLPRLMEAEDMAQAVDLALGAAQEGDAVVLSPACSSFDMFRSYAHRGEVFQGLVRARAGG